MDVQSMSGKYVWTFDKFTFFTESEKGSILEALRHYNEVWKGVSVACEPGSLVEMHDNMIRELEESLGV